MKELLEKYLKECYDIHNVQIPDKYIPYLLEFGKAIHNNAVDSCIENAEVDGYKDLGLYEVPATLEKESLLKLKL